MDKNMIIAILNTLYEERIATVKILNDLPKGYVQTKTISGRQYFFRQWREGQKIKSVYINKNYVGVFRRKIQLRKLCAKLVKDIDIEIENVEKNAIKKGILTTEELSELIKH